MLSGPEAHHLRAVLRLSPGDRVTLLDGTGRLYKTTLTSLTKDEAEVKILKIREAERTPVVVQFGQALLKGKKMDLLVQKANELGIEVLEPFISSRCEVKIGAPEKEERWQRIILESCKQSGRALPMACRPIRAWEALLADEAAFDLNLIFWEGEEQHSLRRVFDTLAASPRSVRAFIGPEGGFSAEEIRQAEAAGFQAVSLGRRTLRAETASLAAMAILQHHFGNLEC